MSKKDYHRPIMIVESFSTNEFVATCAINPNTWLPTTGIYGVDFDDDFWYDSYEDRTIGTSYYAYQNLVKAKRFTILQQGYYFEEGHQTFLFVGTKFDYDSGNQHDDPFFFWYKGNNYVPLLYANIEIHPDYGGNHLETLYFIDDGSHTVINAS